MRKLLWFSAGFAGACAMLAYGAAWIWLLLASGAALGLVAVLAVLRNRSLLRRAVAVLLGAMAGLAWFRGYESAYLGPLQSLQEELVSLTVTARDFSYDTGFGHGVEGIITLAGRPYQIRAYLSEDVPEEPLSPGDRVEGVFLLKHTHEEKTDSAYYQGNGIFLFGYQQGDVQVTRAETMPWWCAPAMLRQRILAILEAAFPPDTAPFAKALLLGDTRDLDYATTTALKISGILHMVAVSGMHVSLLYSAVSALTLRRRFLTALVGIPVLLLFAGVAGFTPSVMRSSVMVCLMMLATVLGREYDIPTALGFSVLVMLAVNPMAVTSASLQLSVGCVAGILLFNAPIKAWLMEKTGKRKGLAARVQARVCGAVSVTLSAMSLITPLSAWYFGAVSLVSLLTNLLTMWVTNMVFVGLIPVCLLWPGAAGVLAQLLSWPIRYVLWAADCLASLPLAAVYTRSGYIAAWLVFVYVLLGVFLVMKNRRPLALLCCGVCGLCLALSLSWMEPWTSDTRITLLDVGQGQSILLQSQGKTFLVDCGGSSADRTADLAAETLLSQGIARLDGLILTHYDQDHAGGLHQLLSRIGTELLFLPDTLNDLEPPENVGAIHYVWEDLALTFGTARLEIFGPVYGGRSNENSLCVLFDTEKCDILITGDRTGFGERMLLRRRTLPDVDILVAGHHGDREAVCRELLEQVRPELVLISVGQGNLYGHPAPQLLQRLEDFGCTVRRTDENGTIIIRR